MRIFSYINYVANYMKTRQNQLFLAVRKDWCKKCHRRDLSISGLLFSILLYLAAATPSGVAGRKQAEPAATGARSQAAGYMHVYMCLDICMSFLVIFSY